MAARRPASVPVEGDPSLKRFRTSSFQDDTPDDADDVDVDVMADLEEEMAAEREEEELEHTGPHDEEPDPPPLVGVGWGRPPPPSLDERTDTLVFQQVDLDYYVCRESSKDDGRPIIRIYGVTERGNSVMAHVDGFKPYFYVPVPDGFTENHIPCFVKTLDRKMADRVRQHEKCSTYIQSAELEAKQSLMGFRRGRSPFLRVVLTIPGHVPACRGILEQGLDIPGIGFRAYPTFESNIPFVMRFMIDRKIVGGDWMEARAGTYHIRPDREKASHAQVEIMISYDSIISHAPEGEWQKIAPLRILSFDIECAGRRGIFPEPETDAIIDIANVVTIQGESKPLFSNVFCMRSVANIVGSKVFCYDDEKKMLADWRKFFTMVDPDIITGYNIINFDLPYILNRANALKVQSDVAHLGRIRGMRTKMKSTTIGSKAWGTHESKDINLEGRIQLDCLVVMQRDHRLPSYTLNSVSSRFLGEQKEDVHYSIITDLYNGNDETRRRLAVYCLKDARLPQRLLDKLMVVINYIEMARVTGVPMSFLLTRGQQVKVTSQLYRRANDEGLLIPFVKAETSDNKYEGATVIEPRRGYYDSPIVTLDFSSLYPSIMMAHNLCYSTLLSPKEAKQMNPNDYTRTPSGDAFVKSHVRKGVLPQILQDLLSARKRAKDDLKKERDPFRKAVLDGRQLALKVSANSVYGFTGATVGKLPCLEISQSVTAFGRQMIEITKKAIETMYTIANGYSHDAVVVYGDTDSVMIRFGVTDMVQAHELGHKAAEYVTTNFVHPIKLEFEKVYNPYLLISKKRYAGLLWTKPEGWDRIDAKGIETVRRDNCALVRNVINSSLHSLLVERDIEGSVSYVKQMISDLLRNRLDMSLLVISKALSRDAENYAGKQAHVELAERMRKRDAGSAPNVGDRVPYVITKGFKGAKAFEKAEDPIFVLEKNLPIDTTYYLEQQLAKPLLRIFEPVLGPKGSQSLLGHLHVVGDHTRTIHVPTASVGALSKFVVKTLTCLGCKAPIKEADRTVCSNCKPREAEVFHRQVATVNALEQRFSKLWSQCQRCQGSLHLDVLCTSRDCPIFYARKKVQMDLGEAETALSRFDLCW